MFAILERPEIITMDKNGKKKYIKLFKGNNKTKSQIAVVYNDENGDYVYTTIPVTKHKNYILKEVNSGNVIYKKGQTRVKNNSAANNIINDNTSNINPNVNKHEDDVFFQSAYHGTPHRFDEFSTEHIGSGEGVQAHGWGLYFAGNKDVSEEYRTSLIKGGTFGDLLKDIKIGHFTLGQVIKGTCPNKTY